MKLAGGIGIIVVLVLFAGSLELLFPTPNVFFDSINFSREGKIVFDDAPLGSNPNSNITFAYFMDFRCPSCIQQHQTMVELQKNYPQVNFLYKHIASVDPEYSPFAAAVFECANKQDLGFVVSDIMFQERYTQSQTLELIETAGVNPRDMATCLSDPIIKEKIKGDRLHASYLGVKGTPTTILNGIVIEGLHSYEVYEALIERVLE